jgi:hypothetical protein
MARRPHDFKRVVLGLHPSSPERIMKLAVELADLLDVELLGLFLEDTGLRNLAGIPFAREFRLLGGGWHPIDVDRLSHDLAVAARNIERAFTAATRGLLGRSQFSVLRGPMVDAMASIMQAGDIVILAEPVSPAERSLRQFYPLVEAAVQSAAAVMLVPPHPTRTKGSIVAIATSPDDPSILAAAAIALAANEELVVLETFADANHDPSRIEALPDIKVERISAGKALLADPGALTYALRQLEERLIVMTRDAGNEQRAATIAATRRVSVLLIEPVAAMARAKPIPAGG